MLAFQRGKKKETSLISQAFLEFYTFCLFLNIVIFNKTAQYYINNCECFYEESWQKKKKIVVGIALFRNIYMIECIVAFQTLLAMIHQWKEFTVWQ